MESPKKNIKIKKIPKRHRRYGIGFFNFFFLIAIAAFLFISAFAFYVVNRDEDIEWLRARIESTFNERADGAFVVTLESARIAVRDEAGATLHLGGLNIEGKNKKFSLQGRSLAIRPHWFSLLAGNLKINSVKFDDSRATVRMQRAEPKVEGDFFAGEKLLSELENNVTGRFSFEDLLRFEEIAEQAEAEHIEDEQKDEAPDKVPEILQLAGQGLLKAGQVFEQMRSLELGDVALTNVSVDVTDENDAPLHGIIITSATLNESDGELGAQQNIEITTKQRGENGVGLKITHLKHTDSSKQATFFEVSNFIARNFIERLNLPDYPIDVAVPFSSKGQVVIDDTATVSKFNMSVFVGDGFVRTSPTAVFNVDSGELNLSLNSREQSIIIEPSPFVFGKNEVIATGNIELPAYLGDPYRYEFTALDSYFDSPDVNSEPVVVERMVARGALQPKQKLLSISSFELNAGEVDFTAALSFGFEKRTPSMALAAQTTAIPIGVLKQLWPVFIATSARGWAVKNIHSGIVSEGSIKSAVPGGVLGRLRKGETMRADEMQVDFKLTNGSFNTFGDFPNVDNADVTGKVRGVSFTADLKSGSARSTFGKSVAMKNAKFHIPDFRFPGPTANITLEVDGDARDLGEIVNRNPVRALQYVKIEPKAISGTATADVDVTVPLRAKLKPGEVVWRAGLNLVDFTSTESIDGRSIKRAKAKVEINPKRMTITGKGNIDGIDADIDLIRPFDGKESTGSLAVKLILNDKDRKKIGLDLEDYLSGPVSVAIEQKGSSKGELYKIDLSRAEIKLDFVGWRKAKGIPARAEMRFTTDKNGTKVRDFVLKGDGFGASGDIDLTKSGEIQKLSLRKVALKNGDNLRMSARLRSERTYEIEIDGSSFDARSLIKVITSIPSDSPNKEEQYRYKIRADIDRVTGYLNEVISKLSLDVTMRSATPLRLEASGLTKGAKKPFSISYGSINKRGDVLKASGSNGGALARFGNVYYRAFGGRFQLSAARPPGAKAMVGNFRMRRFKLVEEPALRGLSAAKNNRGQSSVKFDVLDVNFIEKNQRLTLNKGLLTGENVGGTYEGVLNRKTKAIDFTGTYVPAYVINNFISKIPIVGLALGNGQREGLIGVTFKVAGTLGKPQVTVNPLSALAPGFLRQLFRFKKAQENTN
ncbi:MAG: AsmA-like C-terminal domain-containing protein [Hyphomicrobiales bacterium]